MIAVQSVNPGTPFVCLGQLVITLTLRGPAGCSNLIKGAAVGLLGFGSIHSQAQSRVEALRIIVGFLSGRPSR